jgi:excisionase family DNA binding protein
MENQLAITINTGQFARAIGITTQTARAMVGRGEIQGSMVGGRIRIPASELERYRLKVFGVVKQEQLMAIVERNVAAAFNEATEDGAA